MIMGMIRNGWMAVGQGWRGWKNRSWEGRRQKSGFPPLRRMAAIPPLHSPLLRYSPRRARFKAALHFHLRSTSTWFHLVPLNSTSRRGGSAIVPIAVGRVPRPTPCPIGSCGLFPGSTAKRRQAGMCLAGRQTRRAGRTRSPEIVVARSEPLKTSRNQENQLKCLSMNHLHSKMSFPRSSPIKANQGKSRNRPFFPLYTLAGIL